MILRGHDKFQSGNSRCVSYGIGESINPLNEIHLFCDIRKDIQTDMVAYGHIELLRISDPKKTYVVFVLLASVAVYTFLAFLLTYKILKIGIKF